MSTTWKCFYFLLGALVSSRGEECPTRPVDCSGPLVYPNFDGSCNNVANPLWGATKSPHRRLLPPVYGPGDSPRDSAIQLPSARYVSNRIGFGVFPKQSNSVTRLHVAWGQFNSHDIARTPMVTENGILECLCDSGNDECMDIALPHWDKQNVLTGRTCFSLPRSTEAVGFGCAFTQREQFNYVTSYIDASQVYGARDADAIALRDPDIDGALITQPGVLIPHLRLLPDQDIIVDPLSSSIDCPALVHKPQDTPCLVAGDIRVNENTMLSALHTVWSRYHNFVANGLKKVNADWDSDKLYNEARMVVIAMQQLVTFREYLPPLLGDAVMQGFGLKLVDNGYWYGYDPFVDATVVNAFPTASFRYGHSMFSNTLTQRNPLFEEVPVLDTPLEDAFFDNEPLLGPEFGVGGLMRGFMEERADQMDSVLVEDLRNKLFKKFGDTFGEDLLSFNIQRGRDHGLPGYNEYRELCGLKRATTFEDLSGEMNCTARERLLLAYRSVEKIDLYAGGISENAVPGGEIGPTFACLMARGFRALRRGDRFWHESPDSPTRFTLDQLSALRQISLASVLCEVAEDMIDVRAFPLLQDSAMLNCPTEVPQLDLSAWSEAEEAGKMQDETIHPNDLEWTRWFIKPSDSLEDGEQLAEEIRGFTDGEICDPIVGYQYVELGASGYTHVRFSCAPGTIKASDFPLEISHQTCFGDWIHAAPGVHVLPEELCDNAIHLQARVVGGNEYARETSDVFQWYSVSHGFLCVDAQQFDGGCEDYEVRALCPGPCGK